MTKVGDEVFMPSSYVNSSSTSGYGTVIAVETETKYLIRYRNGGQAWVSQWHLDNFGGTVIAVGGTWTISERQVAPNE